MAKVIVISHIPLPYSQIGSWSTLYNSYLTDNHQIDIIICPKPHQFYPNVQYALYSQNPLSAKIFGRFSGILRKVKKVIEPDQQYVIQIIDSKGLVRALNQHLIKIGVRSNCYIQYFYHGFPPIVAPESSQAFFSGIDEMVFLTNASLAAHQQTYSPLPKKLSVMHNGIDTAKFFRLTDAEKDAARHSFNLSGTVFIWCSQDRPKKGLDLILSVWRKVYNKDYNMRLLVVGCEPRECIEGVEYIGPVPNDRLPIYFQMSDVMLFPTLCEEGFGMSLIEALHCGCCCIASALGGVPEVLQNGKFGTLIEDPTDENQWIKAISDYLALGCSSKALPTDLYSTENWNKQMSSLIHEAKNTIDPK